MIEKIKALCVKYREILVYLVVGVLTTIFSMGTLFALIYLGKLLCVL